MHSSVNQITLGHRHFECFFIVIVYHKAMTKLSLSRSLVKIIHVSTRLSFVGTLKANIVVSFISMNDKNSKQKILNEQKIT